MEADFRYIEAFIRGINRVTSKAGIAMSETARVERRRQFCARCGQLMFELYRSPDGHFGLASDLRRKASRRGCEMSCPTCGACYRLLERVDAGGRPVARV